jgi:PadR family transcriptional regulator, regulatory protein AphA
MCPMVRRPLGIEIALLGFLVQDPKHGYQIYRMLCDPTGLASIWRLKQSQLYALLAKLEKDGYVTSTIQSQEPHPPRRILKLTKLGDDTFTKWMSSPVETPRLIRQEFMAKLYFARQEGLEKTKALIEVQRTTCQSWTDEFERQIKASEPVSYRRIMYQYRLGQVQALQSWLDSCE